ncbi:MULTISPECIES: TetR/AcrR family transcriptional regulator [Calothrix]|uniref:TetR/AcrR family transcriptional regulator n=2 Tax=Calothrix TaxID=1186 RepID=A0ABR8A8E9_9CYAN|nr:MULTISPECIES: TetR/AcrR family transcriptional regulator [Calothrix]MBD2195760.1 TetR/AcrR family transcriptional regulator [Calothrix parietina FACHB-288]MBD2224416.1 TetR/AcrR family transcriptional regulator [Calothrix anomala FACHB-343]
MTTESSAARQQILETASLLFYQKGIQHVGINEVIAASGVAKRTLYRWFSSKDQLIEEVMKYRAAQWLRWFENAVADQGNTPKERLLATFDVLQGWYALPDFRGCPFINAVLEIADASHPAHQVSVQLRESIRTYIMQIASQAGVRDPESFSQQYLLLIGGASLMATIEGNPIGAQYARNALSVLIDASGT